MPHFLPNIPLFVQSFIALLAICLFAQVELKIPKSDISATLQTLIILLVAMLLGAVWGTLTVILYLVIGFIGAPVFSGGASGIEKLWGASGGFLVGFVVAAGVVGYLADISFLKNGGRVVGAFLIGHAIILVLGFARLAFLKGTSGLWTNVFLPLLPGLLFKTLFGSALYCLINGAG